MFTCSSALKGLLLILWELEAALRLHVEAFLITTLDLIFRFVPSESRPRSRNENDPERYNEDSQRYVFLLVCLSSECSIV